MPLSLRRGKVTAIAEQHEGLVRCEVEGEPCVAYPALTGPVAVGDDDPWFFASAFAAGKLARTLIN